MVVMFTLNNYLKYVIELEICPLEYLISCQLAYIENKKFMVSMLFREYPQLLSTNY